MDSVHENPQAYGYGIHRLGWAFMLRDYRGTPLAGDLGPRGGAFVTPTLDSGTGRPEQRFFLISHPLPYK